MGKAARARAKSARKEAKEKAKERKRAMYAQYGSEGRTKGSGRSVLKSKRKIVNVKNHSGKNCGNPACLKCNELTFKGFLNKLGIPTGMPQWMYMRWLAIQ